MAISFLSNTVETAHDAKAPVSVCTGLLAARKETVAFAESATAGLLAASFAATDNSTVLKGGIVCYDPEVKTTLLRVDADLIRRHTAESAEATREITIGLRQLIDADYYVGMTGLIKPGGSETAGKPVGTMFLCIMHGARLTEQRTCLQGSREQILRQALDYMCTLLIDEIMVHTTDEEDPPYEATAPNKPQW